MTPQDILEKYYGYTEFRPGQKKIIDQVLHGQNTLAIMPTGGGKSLCYQVPALLLDGLTLVVSPLISLMKDQVDSLQDSGIKAGFINSSQDWNETRQILTAATNKQLKLLYIAPERLEQSGFMNQLQRLNVSLIAIDEAHCISQWGHDFRKSYLSLSSILPQIKSQPTIIALTATATTQVAQDIMVRLNIPTDNEVKTGFARPNLAFKVVKGQNKNDYILRYVKANQNSAGIIYAATRKKAEQIGSMLKKAGFKAAVYHAGLTEAVKKKNQEDFLFDRLSVIVATNAFGMGIDKSNVRYIIHAQAPGSLEAYYQEAGRAGRDGANAEAILLYSAQDMQIQRLFAENSDADDKHKEVIYLNIQSMVNYVNTQNCLQQFIVRYFGQDMDECNTCSNCTDDRQETDITVTTQKILSCVMRMHQRYGKKLVAQVLAGSKAKRVLELGLNDLSTYGIMRQQKTAQIEELIDYLTASDYLTLPDPQYPTLHLTELGAQILRGQNTVTRKVALIKSNSANPEDSELFEQLRALRYEFAEKQNVPPYVIFSDQTLHEMCRVLPEDFDQMLEIKGVGQQKLAKYGREFLDVLKNYQERSPQARSVSANN
ncbi:DNA helicase RecQ [Ligilactobacillus pobuzihii]|uniref:DNA helicase RecQ n=1 Tax=Ligilactobacillus pobuzihii TaxID=449659 RepID=UPI0003630184|nr:DNA helicase RecQ [Ligilactobacillus pobuzihii]GEN48261.1 ATP-dependent DNA helicase RecQ [Ligilactobacillus pobuzihii]